MWTKNSWIYNLHNKGRPRNQWGDYISKMVWENLCHSQEELKSLALNGARGVLLSFSG